jgi:hypothetical protein
VEKTGIEGVTVKHRPRLLSDNGPCYLAGELKTYLDEQGIRHTIGRPYHPMTQGKIERYHRTLKNVINLENYYLPWQLKHKIGEFVEYYNYRRVHESLDNLTPADVYYGRARDITEARNLVKEQTLRRRWREDMGLAPLTEELIQPGLLRECVCLKIIELVQKGLTIYSICKNILDYSNFTSVILANAFPSFHSLATDFACKNLSEGS